MILNSSKFIMPLPSPSTPAIILWHSSREHSSPRLAMTMCSSSAVMEPLPSMSKMENASLRFSRTSSGSTPLVFNSMNSCKLMWPSPSQSISWIILETSSSVACWPRHFIMEPSSDEEILPSPLVSNFLNTYSNSTVTGAREWLCMKESDNDEDGSDDGGDDEDDVLDKVEVVLGSFFFLPKRDLRPMVVV